jgi:hypothetical protein
MPEIVEPSPQSRTTLFKLRAQQCRYVVSDENEAIFCGAPTHAGSSWCPWHRQLVYTRRPSEGAKTGRGFVLPDYGSAKEKRKDPKKTARYAGALALPMWQSSRQP